MLRAGSEFFSIDAFGLTSSVVVRAGAGDALPDSLEELESLLADRVGVFLAALLLVAAAVAWRERLERSESS